MNNFAIIRSSDAPGYISFEELRGYTERVISGIGETGKFMPPILVMHVSESIAAMVGVGSTGIIRHNHSSSPELCSYYEVWLVGKAVFADYVLALQGVIDDFHALNVLSQHAAMSD